MNNYFNKPNIPHSRVTAAIVSKTDERIIDFLELFGISLLFTRENRYIDFSISSHADVNVFHCGEKKLLLDVSQAELFERLTALGFEPEYVSSPITGQYPGDCRLNCACVGKYAFGKLEELDEKITGLKNFEKINVNQGYAKCSTCIVSESAVITDDASIEKACRKAGLDVLKIEKGDIALSGHEYGFIGGASALVDKKHLAFFGDIRKHRNFEQIEAFLKMHNCHYSYIENYPLTDIGGMIPILQKSDC